MTVKKTQQTLNTTLEKTEQSLNGLETALENNVGAHPVREGGEVNDGLPEGWAHSTIKDINFYRSGNVKPSDFAGELFDLYSVPIFPENRPEKVYGKEIGSSKQLVETGDVLLCKINPRINRVWSVGDNTGNRLLASSEWIVVRQSQLSKNYLIRFFQSSGFRDLLCSDVSGVGGSLTRARPKIVETYIVPLPPLAEQTVIAQTLDTLLAQVENIKTRLDAIPKILKTFRQSVLAAAVSGKLTEAWRGENQCEPVDQLISECASKILDKKSLKFSDKSFRDDEIKHSLPETWAWVRLAKISEVVSGVAKGSKTKEETVQLPYLRVANVQRGYLDLKEVKEISVPRSKAEKLALAKGDILFNEGGDIDKLGRGWIWEDQVENCIHQNHVFRARCYSDLIQPKYISHYGNTEGKEYFLREGTQSVNLANINKTTLSLLPIPLPPSEEQTEIVRRVEELFTFADQIEQQVKNAQGRVNNLTQSILAKAFRGELTGQWRAENQDLITGDNSAEALLAKIQEERDALKKSSKPKTKSTAKKTTRKKAAKKPA